MSQPFNPQEHLIKLPKRVKDPETGQWVTRYDDYIEVKWRLCWFRDKFPHGVITTEEVCVDLDRVVTVDVVTTIDGKRQTQHKTGTGYARFKARVEDGEGGVATGYGTENAAEFTDFVERAETRAIGRALAGLGIGTQFVGTELSEGAHVVDSPVVTSTTNGNGQTPAPESTDVIEHPTEAHLAALRKLAVTVCMDEPEVFEDRMRRAMGVPKQASVAPRLLVKTMSMHAYMEVYGWYVKLEQQLAKSKEVSHGSVSAPQTTPEPTPATRAEDIPAVPPSAAASSSAASDPADAAERDRQRLRAEVATWNLRISDKEREHVIQHNGYSRARQLLWKTRVDAPVATPMEVAAD